MVDGSNGEIRIVDRANLKVLGQFGRIGRQAGQFIAVDLNVRDVPELVKVSPLTFEQPLPADMTGTGQSGGGLVAQRLRGPHRTPAVCHVLDHAQPPPRIEGSSS